MQCADTALQHVCQRPKWYQQTRWPNSQSLHPAGESIKHCSVVLHWRLVLFFYILLWSSGPGLVAQTGWFCLTSHKAFSLFIPIICRRTPFCMCPTDTLTPLWRGCGVEQRRDWSGVTFLYVNLNRMEMRMKPEVEHFSSARWIKRTPSKHKSFS